MGSLFNVHWLILSKTRQHDEMKVEKEESKEGVPTMESFQGKERHGKQLPTLQ